MAAGSLALGKRSDPLLSQNGPEDSCRESSGPAVGEVGATGFEPATTCTPYRCATKLRYAPLGFIIRRGARLVKGLLRTIFRSSVPPNRAIQ